MGCAAGGQGMAFESLPLAHVAIEALGRAGPGVFPRLRGLLNHLAVIMPLPRTLPLRGSPFCVPVLLTLGHRGFYA